MSTERIESVAKMWAVFFSASWPMMGSSEVDTLYRTRPMISSGFSLRVLIRSNALSYDWRVPALSLVTSVQPPPTTDRDPICSQVLGVLNVQVELVQPRKVNLLEHLPFRRDGDRRVARPLRLFRDQSSSSPTSKKTQHDPPCSSHCTHHAHHPCRLGTRILLWARSRSLVPSRHLSRHSTCHHDPGWA